jgi:hypothetical protein
MADDMTTTVTGVEHLHQQVDRALGIPPGRERDRALYDALETAGVLLDQASVIAGQGRTLCDAAEYQREAIRQIGSVPLVAVVNSRLQEHWQDVTRLQAAVRTETDRIAHAMNG